MSCINFFKIIVHSVRRLRVMVIDNHRRKSDATDLFLGMCLLWQEPESKFQVTQAIDIVFQSGASRWPSLIKTNINRTILGELSLYHFCCK